MKFSLDRRFTGFIRNNHETLQNDYPFLLEVKDALEELKYLLDEKQKKANMNRVVIRKSLSGGVEIFLDQEADVFISGMPIDYSKSNCYLGSSLIDDMLVTRKFMQIDTS